MELVKLVEVLAVVAVVMVEVRLAPEATVEVAPVLAVMAEAAP